MGREFKERLYHEFARVGKALASPARIEILDLLAQGEKSVEALAAQTGLTVKNASAHLRELRGARLVETRKAAPYVFYRLADDSVLGLVRGLESLARERLAEVDRVARRYLGDRDELDPIAPDELLLRAGTNAVTLLDVRPVDEYRAGHIAGAISMPLEELERRVGELPPQRDVVVYCRGPYCVFAVDALAVLRRRGFRARRLEGGLPDWRLLGHPVHRDAETPN